MRLQVYKAVHDPGFAPTCRRGNGIMAGLEENVSMPEHETIMPNPDTARRSSPIMILLLLALVVAISGCSREKMDEDASAEQLYNRSEEHTSELQSRGHIVCRLLLEK